MHQDIIASANAGASVSSSDLAYARFHAVNRLDIPPMSLYDAAESGFLNTPADTADSIIRKLELAESYLDECGEYPDRDVTRVVIELVKQGELDHALRYAQAIVASDVIEDFCANPIHAAIDDLRRVIDMEGQS